MSISESMRKALAKAIDLAGGQTAFALLVSTEDRPVSQQLVSYWFRKGELPAELVLRVERLTGVARDELRPDVFLLPEDLKAA
ncbi:transcriptional regulator [Pseudomonas veronii]|uniref:transcriptional regulator n=1 Tax=Pseudomonas veronii TaxID=76761 RepID=UPI000F841BEA|nr:YdaS family helix-turn-helix protein [Pseudomonas veronii]RTY68050.1 transcriptional regulator [Pseudomonas veronii]